MFLYKRFPSSLFYVLAFLIPILILAEPLSLSQVLFAAQVTLAWDPSTAPNVAGYKVYYGNFGDFHAVIDVGNITTATISNLQDGTNYYFAATAYDASSNESPYSNVVIHPPVKLTSDILWRNTSTGDVYLWLMNGVTHTGGFLLGNISDPNWQIVGVGDFNNDSRPDILWRNTSTGENYVWYMNGATYNGNAQIMTVSDPNWQIAGGGRGNYGGNAGGTGGSTGGDSSGIINLAWDPSPDPNVMGYKIYFGKTSKVYDHTTDAGPATPFQGSSRSFQLSGLTPGQGYYISVTSYNSNDESDFSNEVSGVAR